MERIYLAKQGLLSRVGNNQLKTSQSVSLSASGSTNVERSRSRSKRLKVDSVQSPQETKRELDWEDLVIEYLLLRGVS